MNRRRAIFIGVLACCGFVLAQPQNKSIEATTRWPVKACLGNTSKSFQAGKFSLQCESGNLWISIASLKQTLEPRGATFTYSNAQPSGKKQIEIRLPGSTTPIIHTESAVLQLASDNSADNTGGDVLDFEYILASNFFRGLQNTGLPITLSGWGTIQLQVGKVILEFNSGKERQFSSASLYSAALLEFLYLRFPSKDPSEGAYVQLLGEPLPKGFPKPLNIKRFSSKALKPNEVIITLGREAGPVTFDGNKDYNVPSQRFDSILLKSVDHVEKDLSFAAVTSGSQFDFIDNFSTLKASSDQRTPLMMVRFTGQLSLGSMMFETISPTQIERTR